MLPEYELLRVQHEERRNLILARKVKCLHVTFMPKKDLKPNEVSSSWKK